MLRRKNDSSNSQCCDLASPEWANYPSRSNGCHNHSDEKVYHTASEFKSKENIFKKGSQNDPHKAAGESSVMKGKSCRS